MKAFIWNIRSVKSQKAFQRGQMLNRVRNFAFVAVLEPFQHSRYINKYRARMQIPHMFHSCKGKIWCFINYGFSISVESDTNQQLSLLLHNNSIMQIVGIIYT